MPFHSLFFEWLDLTSSEPPVAAAAANATIAAAANATVAAANATAAAGHDLGDFLLSKGHNITQTFWGLVQPALAATAAQRLMEGYDAWCAAAGHPYEYWRRRRMGWWMERLAALGGKDDEDGDDGDD